MATIATPGTDKPLAKGGSTTPFTVTLPKNAHCTGDTAKKGYLVYSYLVRQGTSPTWVNFSGGFPSRGYGLVAPPHTYYGAANTAQGTGEIIGIPNNLEWGPLVTNFGVPLKTLLYAGGKSGVWEAGVACAKSGVVSDYWNTAVTFTSSTTDPNKFVWADTPGPCKAASAAGFYTATKATFTGASTRPARSSRRREAARPRPSPRPASSRPG